MAKKYRKIPVEVEVLEWTGQNHRGMFEFLGGGHDVMMTSSNENFLIDHSKVERGLVIKTTEGNAVANVGDYIIKESSSFTTKYYPCKPSVFNLTFNEYNYNIENRKIVSAQQYALKESEINGMGQLTRIKTAWENGFDVYLGFQEEFINKAIDFGFQKCKEFGDITGPERNDFIKSLQDGNA